MDPGDAELALIVAAQGVLPAVFSAFVLAAIFSAMASTADSQLIVAASAVSSDGYDHIVRGSKPGVGPWLNRLTVAVLGIGAGVVVLSEEVKVYTFVLDYGWAILGAALGPQLALAMLWRGSTRAGCVAGMAVGGILAVAWKLLSADLTIGFGDAALTIEQVIKPPFDSIYNLTAAFLISLVAHVVVSLATSRTTR